MSTVLQIATNVGTPLALLGLVAAIAFYAYSRRLKHEETRLGLLPPTDRATAIDKYLTRYKIKGDDLSKAARERLIAGEMEKRYRLTRLYAGLSALVFLVCFVLAVVAYFATRPPRPTDSSEIAGEFYAELGEYESKDEAKRVKGQLDDLVQKASANGEPVGLHTDFTYGRGLFFHNSDITVEPSIDARGRWIVAMDLVASHVENAASAEDKLREVNEVVAEVLSEPPDSETERAFVDALTPLAPLIANAKVREYSIPEYERLYGRKLTLVDGPSSRSRLEHPDEIERRNREGIAEVLKSLRENRGLAGEETPAPPDEVPPVAPPAVDQDEEVPPMPPVSGPEAVTPSDVAESGL